MPNDFEMHRASDAVPQPAPGLVVALDARQAAKALALPYTTFMDKVHARQIPYIVVGGGRHRQHRRFLPLFEADTQPLDILIDQSHQRGMRFIAGFRMNDGHAAHNRKQGIGIAEFIEWVDRGDRFDHRRGRSAAFPRGALSTGSRIPNARCRQRR